MEKPASKVIEGEMPDLIVGNRPLVWVKMARNLLDTEGDEPKEAVKANVVNIERPHGTGPVRLSPLSLRLFLQVLLATWLGLLHDFRLL